jgi:hypothetical protein
LFCSVSYLRVKVILNAERVGVDLVGLLQVLTIGLFIAAEIGNEANQTVSIGCLGNTCLARAKCHVVNQKEFVSFLALVNFGLGGNTFGAEGIGHKATIDDKRVGGVRER